MFHQRPLSLSGVRNAAWCNWHIPSRLKMMYGEYCGNRSGLNGSMIEHLQSTAQARESFVALDAGDTVLDIGCNDGALLAGYQTPGLRLLGIDPTAEKFSHFHPDGMSSCADFFNRDVSSAISQTGTSGSKDPSRSPSDIRACRPMPLEEKPSSTRHLPSIRRPLTSAEELRHPTRASGRPPSALRRRTAGRADERLGRP